MSFNQKSSKTNILLIAPPTPTTFWSFTYILKHVGKRAAFPPLGLITVAAMIPENYNLKLVDMNVTKLNEKDIKQADLIFTSSMIVHKEALQDIIAICKKYNKPVVAGGPYPTSSSEKITGVDHFLLGEVEETLPLFFKDYENGKAKSLYEAKERPDIKQTPIPRFDLIDYNKYSTLSLQYSRGCPFNCEFCDIIEMFGRTPRVKGNEQFIAELEAIYQTGYRGPMMIVDDNFIGNKPRVKSLLKDIIKWQKEKKYAYMFLTEASINLAEDEELMDLMIEAGFNKVFIGIETPDEDSLLMTQKKQNTKSSMLDSIDTIQGKGIEVAAGFILGFDTDKDDIFDRQIKFIEQSMISWAMVGLLTALPQTQLYRRLEKEGRMLEESHGNNTHHFYTNFKTKMDPEILSEGYKRVLATIYDPKNFFERGRKLVEFMPKGKVFKGAVNYRTIIFMMRVLFYSLTRQTFSNYGKTFLSYLFKVIKNKPSLFPKAIKIAFTGHHFIRLTEEIIKVDKVTKTVQTKLIPQVRKRITNFSVASFEGISKEITALYTEVSKRLNKKYKIINEELHKHIDEPINELVNDVKTFVDSRLHALSERVNNGTEHKDDTIKNLYNLKQKIKTKMLQRYSKLNGKAQQYSKEILEFFEIKIDNLIASYANA